MTLPSWSITLPMPPSVNSMFVNRSSKGMKGRMLSKEYMAWRKEADAALWFHKPLPQFLGRVAICMALGEPKRAIDPDNRIKAAFDFLVKSSIIIDDSSKYVRMILLTIDPNVTGCKLTVSEME